MSSISILTDTALAKIVTAAGTASAVEITHVAVGDGGGAAYDPTHDQVALVNETHRVAIDWRVETNPNTWWVQATFPATGALEFVREIGFFDADGALISIEAGLDFEARPIGVIAYVPQFYLNFDRAAADGAVTITAPDNDLFEHAVHNLETQALGASAQLDERLARRDMQEEIAKRDGDLVAETAARISGDSALSQQITAEAQARAAGDAGLTQAIAEEAETRGAADLVLVPPGAVMAFARADTPAGWLNCDGAAVSRDTYANLFAAVGDTFGAGDGATTFNLPDLRGEFIRGFDEGRGVDAGRAFGSAQADDLKSHTHTGTADEAGAHTHTTPTGGDPTGAGAQSAITQSGTITTDEAGAHTHALTIEPTGGTETRPRNVALKYCIRF